MSWMKGAPGGAPPPGRDRQAYGAPQPQPFGNQQNMYSNFQGGVVPANQQQQYWQVAQQGQPQQQHPYNQQYGQVYQQDYAANANQFYQQPNQFNQNYTNQDYTGAQQTNSYPQEYHQNQVQHQNFNQQPKVDGWDNWDWGWEDSNKQGQKPQQNATQPQAMIQQQPTVNNANVIEESFGATDTWTWAMDDKKNAISHPEPHSTGLPQTTQEPQMLPVSNANPVIENNSVPDVNAPKNSNNLSSQHVEEVRTLNDKDVVKEHLPNLALGKRFNLENLTPQWSIESQMSQESSDGPHTHSEGTHRTQSRNSNKSSPGINTDNSNFNFSQSGIEDGYTPSNEWSRPSDEVTLVESLQGSSRRESHDELSNSLQEMNLNHKNHSTSNKQVVQESVVRTVPENIVQPPLSISPGSFPPPVSSSLPPPPMSAAMPPPPPVSSGTLPPASSSSALPGPPPSMSAPPPNIAPMSNQNPFKHAGPFSHKTLSKGPSPNQSAVQSLPPQIPSTNLSAPAVVNKVSQHNRVPIGFEANLETTPDNSERPDQPQLSAFRPMSVQQHVPDNMEVAPRNDRNEYLQTAHLSGGDYNENTDFSRNAPPPGLRRMVVGQQESEYGQSLNISGDEPPPGLARMVPGQQTEAEVIYNQSSDNYMDRHIDGQPTDSGVRPYRQADGQQTPDYPQPAPGRGSDRRPIGLDRMVPGEPSNNEYPQYANSSYGGPNDQRVVMGVYDYPIPTDAGPTDVREQNVDGSDYSEPSSRNPPRNVIGARESSNDVSPDYSAPLDEQQRELTMEGENLQDLSVISSVDLAYSRDQTLDGADLTLADIATDRKTDLSDSIDLPATGSRRQSLNRVNTSGEDSERDRAFKASPRRDRDKHKSAKNRDRDRDREKDRDRDRDRERDKEGRYSRGKYERDDRRAGRDDRRDKERRDRRDRDDSPEARRARRAARTSRPPADDTDYYSDRERDRRHRREGSYTSSKPPRPDDHRDRDRDRDRKRYTVERDRRYDDDRDRRRSDKYRDRYERSYRDIDPTRKYGNLRRPRDKDDRRGEFSSPSRPGSGEHTATDDDGEPRRRDRRPRHARTAEPFYDEYADPYAAQRRQYEYYEHLRLTNPAAYMQVYKQLLAGRAPPVPPTYGDEYLGYGVREERGSVHSGRSSTTGLKGNDTDLNTDMSLNLHLEDSTVRSERMTPFRFSTAHIKGSISSRDVVVVRPSYPVDGAPATVQLLSLAQALAHDPDAAELTAFPGPLVNGVTHKKSVMDYCAWRARRAPLEATCDVRGYGLLWTLLALLLRQNGVVVGSDIAELLMKNTQEDEEAAVTPKPHDEGRGSSASDSGREEPATAVDTPHSESATVVAESEDPRVALDRLREYLIYGNRQEALEWAMSHQLWGHALHLSAYGDRRTRALVSSRFVSALPRTDPLHTLYTALAGNIPPAVTGVSDERWGDWRPHAAMLLANAGARPEHDSRALTQLGDSLLSRGLLYSAQFCFVSAGRAFERHPLAPLGPPGPQGPCSPPRLALLLADSRSHSLREFASNRAIFATEVYEYALSLRQDHYVIPELQVYKLLLATRLVDCGQYERALAYAEAAARAVTQQPRLYEPALAMRLADLADRLKFHDPALQAEPVPDEGDSLGDSPRHQQWIDDVRNTAHALAAESAQASQQVTPLHQATPPQPHVDYYASQQYGWTEQAQQYQPPPPAEPSEETPDYAQQYYAQAPAPPVLAPGAPPAAPEPEPQPYPAYGEEWPRNDDYASSYADPYWNGDHAYGYGEAGEGEVGAAAAPRPAISMPGATSGAYHHEDRPPSATDQTDRETDTPKQSGKAESKGKDEAKAKAEGRGKGGGWLGGILTKLSLRPPNQMILPDDKNPTIVWDAEHKRWRNVDGDADEPEPPPPPPRLQDLQPPQSASPPLATPAMGAPPSAPVSNIFKMQKSRHIKKSYVDVFNPSGAATRPLPPASEVLGPPAPSAGAAPALFVPQPMPAQETENLPNGH